MNKQDQELLMKIIEITIEVGPDVVQGVVDLCRSGKMTAEQLQAMKENSKSPKEILAEHGISLD